MIPIRPVLFLSVCCIVVGLSELNRTLFLFEPLTFPQSTKIYDRHGVILYELYGEMKRTPIPLSEIPLEVREATIAAEDKNFYTHHGFDVKSIARAASVNFASKSFQQGGSTISQQLVRNALLTPEKNLTRKFKELILSLKLEQSYTKDEILEMYLNAIPYGSNTYGVEAASENFFGKPAKDLTAHEAVYLAALPKAPSYYSPYGAHRDELDARVQSILMAMQSENYLTSEEAAVILEEEVVFMPRLEPIRAPHFVMYVIDQLRTEYGDDVLLQQGLEVTTSLDLRFQTLAEETIHAYVQSNETAYNAGNAALVSIDPRTGDILAMVGSHDYFDETSDGAVNVAIQPRQPGSSFKPYVYATAFKKGMNPASLLMDVVTNFGRYGDQDYIPQDYDGRTRGPVSARMALQGSLNIPAVKTLFYAGIDDSIETAKRMGITTLESQKPYGPTVVLGSAEVTLLDHTSAFGVFAAGGVRHEARSILSIKNHLNQEIKSNVESEGVPVLDPAVAYQITHVLSDNEARQYIFHRLSRNLVLTDRPVAAKTGTTQAYRDAWTVGYTPSLVTGVWVGNNDNTSMRYGADGSVVAAPIWHDFMESAVLGTPVEAFVRPATITEIAVDTVSGKLPTVFTPRTHREIFAPFNIPTEYDDVHVPIMIDGAQHVATIFHAEKNNQPHWESGVQQWLGAVLASKTAETEATVTEFSTPRLE